MKNKILFVVLVLLIFFFHACFQKSTKIELGKFNQNKYVNEQFDLLIEVPENYFFLDQNQRRSLSKTNMESIIEDKEQVEYSLKKSALIFTIFKFNPDTIIEVNPNITITATNISGLPELEDSGYAVQEAMSALKEMNKRFVFDNQTFEFEINDKKYTGFNSSITVDDMTANYSSFMGNFDNFNLTITISFKNEKQKSELLKIIKNIKPTKNNGYSN